jgi:hypothetical protein
MLGNLLADCQKMENVVMMESIKFWALYIHATPKILLANCKLLFTQ